MKIPIKLTNSIDLIVWKGNNLTRKHWGEKNFILAHKQTSHNMLAIHEHISFRRENYLYLEYTKKNQHVTLQHYYFSLFFWSWQILSH